MEAMKSLGVVVFVNTERGKSEMNKLPASVIEAMKSIDKSLIPYAYITSADLTQNFGGFSYKTLKPQDFRSIFKAAKKKIREAKKVGALTITGLDENKEEQESDEVTLSSPKYEQWETAKGKTIKAMLLGKKGDDTYVFKNAKGKKIEVKPHHLSESSQQRAKEMIDDA